MESNSEAEEDEDQEVQDMPSNIATNNPELQQKMEEWQAIKTLRKVKQKAKASSSVAQRRSDRLNKSNSSVINVNSYLKC